MANWSRSCASAKLHFSLEKIGSNRVALLDDAGLLSYSYTTPTDGLTRGNHLDVPICSLTALLDERRPVGLATSLADTVVPTSLRPRRPPLNAAAVAEKVSRTMFVRFSVIGGPQDGLEIEIGELPLTLGREGHASFPTSDRWTSRHHCQLFSQEGRLAVRDLGSKHGTYVNGQRIEQAQLEESDRLMIGLTVLIVRQIKLAGAAAERPPSDRPSGDNHRVPAR